MKIGNISTSELLSIAATAISVIALLSSIKSCQISEKAHELAILEYNSNRSLVLKGDVQGTSTDLRVTPHDPSFLLHEVYYQFPSEIGTSRKLAPPPDYVLSLSPEIANFKKLLIARYRDGAGKTTIGENARMPFLVESFSTVKGLSHRDRSIYTLNFKFEVPGNPKLEPRITVTGITFGSRVDRTKNAEEVLEKTWIEAKSK